MAASPLSKWPLLHMPVFLKLYLPFASTGSRILSIASRYMFMLSNSLSPCLFISLSLCISLYRYTYMYVCIYIFMYICIYIIYIFIVTCVICDLKLNINTCNWNTRSCSCLSKLPRDLELLSKMVSIRPCKFYDL